MQEFRERVSNLKEFSSELIQSDILNPQTNKSSTLFLVLG
ncbi:hypothetical protein LEP1GSC007_2793 [Leptospira interrogans serovar Bulgarica str. Mallika]|nr:hypothetical protein LEP1GSC007_2793 [Leptospira interrogans serovar Bulgarica str. Mallika]